jgi:hypothetical protein
MTIRISNFVVFHMEVSFEIIFTMPFNEIASCAQMPIDDTEKGTLLHIGRLSKSDEKIDDLMEKAGDLWLEKERLESIAIAAGAPDANAAKLAADEASSAALLAYG